VVAHSMTRAGSTTRLRLRRVWFGQDRPLIASAMPDNQRRLHVGNPGRSLIGNRFKGEWLGAFRPESLAQEGFRWEGWGRVWRS